MKEKGRVCETEGFRFYEKSNEVQYFITFFLLKYRLFFIYLCYITMQKLICQHFRRAPMDDNPDN